MKAYGKYFDRVQDAIIDGIQGWEKQNTTTKIKKEITKLLDYNKTMIVRKLLGFEWNNTEWRLDHCNGRSGNSTAGDYLKEVAGETIREWFMSIELEAPEKEFQEMFQREYERVVKQEFDKMITSHAKTKALQLFEELVETSDSAKLKQWAENYIKLKTTIHGGIHG